MRRFWLLGVLVVVLMGCERNGCVLPDYSVHTFYYDWYGNPEHDGAYRHWAHEVLPHWSDTSWNNVPGFPGGEEIGADFYPSLGCYSCSDTALIHRHLKMIREAGIGTVAITWWGKGSFEDERIPLYLREAEREQLKVVLHIEPFYDSVEEFRKQLAYAVEAYGWCEAFYRYKGKPFFYVYDSYRLKMEDWARLLQVDGDLSVRGTALDGTFIGLWVNEDDGEFFEVSGFDGFYTYFASDGFVYGSSTKNWGAMADWAKRNGKLFVPCVGPGYKDTRIRPWNVKNCKERKRGAYLERMWDAAMGTESELVGITSFNEWHEGTQIEPAVSKCVDGYRYDDYEGLGEDYYMLLINKCISSRRNQKK